MFKEFYYDNNINNNTILYSCGLISKINYYGGPNKNY